MSPMRILLFWVCSDRPRACETVSVTDNSIICNNATGYLEWSTNYQALRYQALRFELFAKNIFKTKKKYMFPLVKCT